MSDLDPAELSAFLDGELDEPRAVQVGAIIASDERVRADYELLMRADARWRSMARRADFRPRVRWPTPAKQSIPAWVLAPLLLIPFASVAGKLSGAMIDSLMLNTLSLVVLIVFVFVTDSFRTPAGQMARPTGS
jgi:anti-sigma factor RsiW